MRSGGAHVARPSDLGAACVQAKIHVGKLIEGRHDQRNRDCSLPTEKNTMSGASHMWQNPLSLSTSNEGEDRKEEPGGALAGQVILDTS